MTTATIREKLHEYINYADDKKLKALFTVLDGEVEKANSWWEDGTFVAELEKRSIALESGEDRGYSKEEVEASIEKLRIQKYGKS